LKACEWRAACGEGRAASAHLSEAACSGCMPFFLGVRIGVRTPFGCAAIKPHHKNNLIRELQCDPSNIQLVDPNNTPCLDFVLEDKMGLGKMFKTLE
jgi:hypothetical protein